MSFFTALLIADVEREENGEVVEGSYCSFASTNGARHTVRCDMQRVMYALRSPS